MKIKETSPAYLTHRKVFTYQDYLDLPDDGKRYEVINGELIMTPAPYTIHQKTSRRIIEEFIDFLKNNPMGEVLYAPVDVVLSETNVFQPDILFIANENSKIITEKNVIAAPDLVIEILSPSTGYYDLTEKKDIYAEFEVKEYWIVDPKKQWIEIYTNKNGKFKLIQRLEKYGILKSQTLSGFEISAEKIFQSN